MGKLWFQYWWRENDKTAKPTSFNCVTKTRIIFDPRTTTHTHALSVVSLFLVPTRKQTAATHTFTHWPSTHLFLQPGTWTPCPSSSIPPLCFCESYFVAYTPNPPPRTALILATVRAALKRNWKRFKHKPRAFVRDACCRGPVRTTRKWNDVRRKLRTAFPSISTSLTFAFLLLLPRKFKQTAA